MFSQTPLNLFNLIYIISQSFRAWLLFLLYRIIGTDRCIETWPVEILEVICLYFFRTLVEPLDAPISIVPNGTLQTDGKPTASILLARSGKEERK